MTGLRVALLAGPRFPVVEPFAGGLETHTWLLADGLQRLGCRVTMFGPGGGDPRFRHRPFPVAPVLSEVARADVSMSAESHLIDHHAYLGVMLELAGAADEFDVVLNNSIHHLPVALARLLPVPMVTTLHTPPTAWTESALALPLPASLRCVAVSEHTAAAWRHSVDARVIRNGIDLDAWRPGPGGDHAVWTGRVVREKAPHLAIDAARAAGLTLHLAGPSHDREYWASEIEPRLGPDVVWHGHLPQHELATLVGGSAVCLVTPEWDEPFGLVVLEALACGTPVAAFARGGVPEVVDDRCARLAPAGDVAALARAVREAAGLSRAATRERACEIGDVRRMCREYLQLCQASALGGGAGLAAVGGDAGGSAVGGDAGLGVVA